MAKRVLVADDSVTIQKAFAMVLSSQDITLSAARSVDDALSSARQTRPDLVIADASLGNGNGYDLCTALKNDPAMRGVPVFILSSTQVPYDESRGQRSGASGFFLKPFESQSLIDQLTTALARVDGRPAAAPQVVAASPAAAAVAREPQLRTEPTGRDEEDYGEFTIERSSGGRPIPAALRSPVGVPAPLPAAAPAPLSAPAPMISAPPAARPAVVAPTPGLRPSLIPGVRPGAPLPPRPPATASHLAGIASTSGAGASAIAPAPVSPFSSAIVAVVPGSPAMPRQTGNRTIMGLPAVMPPSPPAPAPPVRPPVVGTAPMPVLTAARSAPVATVAIPSVSPSALGASAVSASIGTAASSAVSSALAQKMSALAARGPEYEAIAKLSREVIEQVVWEVVPELAEMIIRQEVDRLASSKR